MRSALRLALLVLLAGPAAAQTAAVAGSFDYYVLALSWEPVFCDSHAQTPECKAQSPQRYDATHLVLHGLWPNKVGDLKHDYGYCGVDAAVRAADAPASWCSMPAPALDDQTHAALEKRMPGAASCLERHEWYKHGTCAGLDAQSYFGLADSLVDQAATTSFGRYLAAHVGQTVKRDDLTALLQADFGGGAANVVLRCAKVGGADALSEVWLYLKKPIPAGAGLATLLTASDSPLPGNCPASVLVYKK